MRRFATALALLNASLLPFGAFADTQRQSPYAGEQGREIKSLSPDDVEQLRRGAGWGLAKAAELNGYPGPVHLLELKTELGLDERQIAAISAIYEDMKREAVRLGEELIRHEQRLEDGFRGRALDEATLRDALDGIADTRRDLRFAHLAAHLKARPLLTEQQIAAYWTLRGYGVSDLCQNPPAGHDPAMWRQHNSCP